jgi:WhiB family redox-sensing transcriptional regulator
MSAPSNLSVLPSGRVGARSPVMSAPSASLAHAEPSWRASAECQGATAGVFYPPSTTETREQRQHREGAARDLCGRCKVREACLEYALFVQEPYGIWGGMNELERRRLLRRRAAC